MPFSTINNISILGNNSNSTFVFFKQACHANSGSEKKWAGSNSLNLMQKLSNTFAVSPYLPIFFMLKFFYTLIACF